MATVAQALQIARVGKPRPVTVMRHNVVNVGRSGAQATGGTRSAERLAGKLLRPQLVCPDGQAVPAAVGTAALTAARGVWRAVCVAIAAAHQRRAARIQAWAHGFAWHDTHSLPAKEKADLATPSRGCYAVGSDLNGFWLTPSKSTVDSCLHFSHHSGKCCSLVSPGTTWTLVVRPHRGHTIFIL